MHRRRQRLIHSQRNSPINSQTLLRPTMQRLILSQMHTNIHLHIHPRPITRLPQTQRPKRTIIRMRIHSHRRLYSLSPKIQRPTKLPKHATTNNTHSNNLRQKHMRLPSTTTINIPTTRQKHQRQHQRPTTKPNQTKHQHAQKRTNILDARASNRSFLTAFSAELTNDDS